MTRKILKIFIALILCCACKIGFAEEKKDDAFMEARQIAQEFQGKPQKEQTVVTLSQILKRVLQNNWDIKQKKAMLESAAGEKLIFRSRALPDVNATVIGGRYGERDENNPAKNFAIFGGKITHPLFEAGIPASWRLGDIAVIIAQQNLQETISKKLHETRIAFYGALFYRGLVLLNRQSEKNLEANLSHEIHKQKSGLGARGSVIRAKVQFLNQKPDTAEAEKNYQEALLQLAVLVGANLSSKSSDSFFPKGVLDYEPVQFNLKAEINDALKNRTDLKLLRSMIFRTAEQKNVSEEAFYPMIDMFFDGEFLPENALRNNTSNSPRPGEDTRKSEARLGGIMTWRVIDNGQTIGQTMRWQKKKEGYEIALKKLEENIPRDLSRVEHSIKAEDARILALYKAVQLAEENLNNIEAQVTAGKSGHLDFINAHSAFYEAKFGILKGLYQRNLALAEWDRIAGRYLCYAEKPFEAK